MKKNEIISVVMQRLKPNMPNPESVLKFRTSYWERLFESATVSIEAELKVDQNQINELHNHHLVETQYNGFDVHVMCNSPSLGIDGDSDGFGDSVIVDIDRVDKAYFHYTMGGNRERKDIEVVQENKDIIERMVEAYIDFTGEDAKYIGFVKDNVFRVFPRLSVTGASDIRVLVSFRKKVQKREHGKFDYPNIYGQLVISYMLWKANVDQGDLKIAEANLAEYAQNLKRANDVFIEQDTSLHKDRYQS